MPITVQEIMSEGIEEQWIDFARQHWEEHVPEHMASWFDPDVRTIQAMEEVGKVVGFVAMDGDTTVGYALVVRGGQMFSHRTHEWTVLCIYTHPAVRRKGVFAKILDALEAEAIEDGAVMFNMTAPMGFKAHDFMESEGYWAAEVIYRKQVKSWEQ